MSNTNKISTENFRKPIGKKIRSLVSNVAFAALLVTVIFAMITMSNIREKNKEILITQMETNLYNTVRNKAKIADAAFGKYAGYIEDFTAYINGLYKNPSRYLPNEVLPPRIENKNVYAMQRYLADENMTYEGLKSEFSLLGNIEQVWVPFMRSNHKIITTIYLGTENGILLAYDKDSEVASVPEGQEAYYNFLNSEWYSNCKKSQHIAFTDIYNDVYGRGAMISCYGPFYDNDGEFAGVMGMDILVSDIFSELLALDLGRGASAFLVNQSGKIISSQLKDEQKAPMLADDSEISPQIVKDMLIGRTSVGLSENKIYYAYTPLRSTGWELCIKIPQTIVLSHLSYIYSNVDFAIMVFLLSFLIIQELVKLAGLKFSAKLVEPILKLSDDVKEISDGNLEHRAEIRSNDEIGDLAKSFNDMAASLKNYIKNLADVTAEKERIGAELNIATQIQSDMLPKIVPPFMNNKAFDICATMHPAKEVGGDFYDFFMIDDDHLALVMADVSGKGVPAALFMVIAKTLIKNRSMMGGTPGEILADVNNQLCEGNESDLFVTVWLGILELSTGKIKAANAGHEFPAVRRSGGKYELMTGKHSPAVATFEGLKFAETEICLEHLDTLYLYTDGVAEATNINDELYGTDKMIEELNKTIGEPANEVLSIMNKSVMDFTGEAPQFDDITMLCLQFFGKVHELTVEAKTEKLDEVIAFIDEYLEKWGCSMKFITQIELAVEEIFVNIASYAYKDKEGMATISIRHMGKDVEIMFSDNGTPYNPLEKEDPDMTLSVEDKPIGGMGIYIVKKSMNSVNYEYIGDNNVLKIRKDFEEGTN